MLTGLKTRKVRAPWQMARRLLIDTSYKQKEVQEISVGPKQRLVASGKILVTKEPAIIIPNGGKECQVKMKKGKISH